MADILKMRAEDSHKRENVESEEKTFLRGCRKNEMATVSHSHSFRLCWLYHDRVFVESESEMEHFISFSKRQTFQLFL